VPDPALLAAGDFSEQGGRAAAAALLRPRRRPTAIFAANDLSAFGVLAALREAGLRVPRDVSVVGFDDLPAAAHVQPPLTTVRQPLREMGGAAVRSLLARIAGEPAAGAVTLPTALVIRESTTRAP
jgi:LacI family transcriptional regulator